MTGKKKKGFLSKLFFEEPKKGGCCDVQFEEVPADNDENENTDKVDKKPDIRSKEQNSTNSGDCCCG